MGATKWKRFKPGDKLKVGISAANDCTRVFTRRAIGGRSRLADLENIAGPTCGHFFALVGCLQKDCLPGSLAGPEKLEFWRQSRGNTYWRYRINRRWLKNLQLEWCGMWSNNRCQYVSFSWNFLAAEWSEIRDVDSTKDTRQARQSIRQGICRFFKSGGGNCGCFMQYRNYQGKGSERFEVCAATLSMLGRIWKSAWYDSERGYCSSISMLRRNLEAVSGWGVKGLLWQQMERPAARSLLINRLTVLCRLSRNAADTWSPGTTIWYWPVLHNAPLTRQNALPKPVVLNNTAGLNSSRGQLAVPDWRWLPLFKAIHRNERCSMLTRQGWQTEKISWCLPPFFLQRGQAVTCAGRPMLPVYSGQG